MFARLTTLLVFVTFCTGCSFIQNLTKFDQRTEYVHHRILHRGETLSLISAWYTGSPKNWRVIHSHNPSLDVRNLAIREIVKIPRTITKREDAFQKRELLALQRTFHPRRSIAKRSKKPKVHLTSTKQAAVNSPKHVKEIEGCEHLSHSFEGLLKCADRVSQDLEQFR